MTENKRRHPRTEIRVNVELSFLEQDALIVKTRDISEGGMFLVTESAGQYPLGEMVHVHFLDPLQDERDTHKDAVVVRVVDDGIGISFVEMEAF